MIIYQGNIQHAYHDGPFVLIVPGGLSLGQPFTAYWAFSGVPNIYSGKFDEAPSVASASGQVLHHRGEGCEFNFELPRDDGEAGSFKIIHVSFGWHGERDIIASLFPSIDSVGNAGNDPMPLTYAGVVSGHPEMHDHLIVLLVYPDSGVGDTTQLLRFSPTGQKFEREGLQIEKLESGPAGVVAFAARSGGWALEAEGRGFREEKFSLSLVSADSGGTGSATVELVSANIYITVTLINDSGQTLQYWTARSDPHLAEDLVNLGLETLSFVAPNWSPSKALQVFADGVKVFQRIKKKIGIFSGAGGVAGSSIDLLQRKTGKVNTTDFLEPNQTVTFWDFDGTITGGMDMSLTWFRLDYDDDKKTAVLHFDTATTTFNKLKSHNEIRASTLLDVPAVFEKGEKLKRQGTKLQSPLPEGWTAKTKRINLATPLVRCNFLGQKISNLTLTAGDVPDPTGTDLLPVWSHGMLYNPATTKAYKTTFNRYPNTWATNSQVGHFDTTTHLLYLEGDVNEYPDDDCKAQATNGTFIRHYFYQPLSCSQEQKEKTAWSHKVVFLEYAFIQPDQTGTYRKQKKTPEIVKFPCSVSNPKIKIGQAKDAETSNHYRPFLDAVQEGLREGENWKKRYWAFWFEPVSKHVYGAVYPKAEDMCAGVAPWIIKRKYPCPKKNPAGVPDAQDFPVVAFVCQGDLPINFYNHGVVDDELNAAKYDN
ncbi:hypothetical protein F5Y14DRAFT_455229 [Nemania sp. NC0429]|nr:hypothetical protein F5Y14DRAFT_455229 [Nemania sp. NC0429]